MQMVPESMGNLIEWPALIGWSIGMGIWQERNARWEENGIKQVQMLKKWRERWPLDVVCSRYLTTQPEWEQVKLMAYWWFVGQERRRFEKYVVYWRERNRLSSLHAILLARKLILLAVQGQERESEGVIFLKEEWRHWYIVLPVNPLIDAKIRQHDWILIRKERGLGLKEDELEKKTKKKELIQRQSGVRGSGKVKEDYEPTEWALVFE